MNKKRLFTIFCILVIVVSVSFSLLAVTYARYRTQSSSLDSGRVALWGVAIDVDSNDIFQKVYKKTDSTVIVSSDEQVVSPGATGMATITITGKPEVSTQFILEFNALQEVFLKAGTYLDLSTDDQDKQSDVFLLASDYYPVVFTLTVQEKEELPKEIKKGTKKRVPAPAFTTSTLQQEASRKLNFQTSYYDTKVFTPSEDLKTKFTLTWEWPSNLNNYADTWLGVSYAKGVEDAGLVLNNDYCFTIKYEFLLTVIQVD